MTAVALALLTAVVWGFANYLGSLLSRRHPLGAVLVAGQVVGVIGGLAFYAVDGTGAPATRALLLGIGAGIFNALALATFYSAARVGPISVVAPVGATGGAVPVLAAIAMDERPSAWQLVGIPLAVVGVALAAARTAPPQDAPVEKRAGLPLYLTAALTYGTFLTLFAEASQDGPATAVLTSRIALLLATLNPVITVGLAVLVLGERLNRRQQVGWRRPSRGWSCSRQDDRTSQVGHWRTPAP